MSETPGWSAASIVGLSVSVLCMTPTAITIALVLGMSMFMLGSVVFGLGFSVEAGMWAGLWATMGSFFVSILAAGPVALSSILLHPIGGVTALVAFRAGARRSGGVLVVLHTATFLLGVAVGIWWLLTFGVAFLD